MRIEVNRCECDKKTPVQKTDIFKSIVCDNCMEVISYEKPVSEKKSPSKQNKVKKVNTNERKANIEDIKQNEEVVERNYGFEINKVYNEKCEATMNRIKDGEVDYVFTSPPYNIKQGAFAKYGEGYQDDLSQQQYLEWSIKIIDELLRITKYHVFYNIQELANNSIVINTLLGHYKYKLKKKFIWRKKSGAQATNTHVVSCRWEYILVFSNINPLVKSFDDASFSEGFTDVIEIKHTQNKDADVNKAVFPLALPKKFIDKFGKKEDLWYDPFSGTGTTARAAILSGRNFLGSEMTKKVFDRGNEKIKATQSNPELDFLQEIVEETVKPKLKLVDEGGKNKQILMEIPEDN